MKVIVSQYAKRDNELLLKKEFDDLTKDDVLRIIEEFGDMEYETTYLRFRLVK